MGLAMLLLHYPCCLFIGFGKRIEVGMTIEEIRKNAPDGATHYRNLKIIERVLYFKKINGVIFGLMIAIDGVLFLMMTDWNI